MTARKNILQLLREGRGETQKQCAGAVGVDESTWRRWERGAQPPTSKNLLDLAVHFEVEPEVLRPITQKRVGKKEVAQA